MFKTSHQVDMKENLINIVLGAGVEGTNALDIFTTVNSGFWAQSSI